MQKISDSALMELYENNGLFAKIIDLPAEETLRAGFRLQGICTDAVAVAVNSLDELRWEECAVDALKWARLFGGAVMVMLINDGRGIDEPLDQENIKSINALRVYGRSNVREVNDNIFHVHSKYGDFQVHKSRCLIFRNGPLSERSSCIAYQNWGVPELVRIKNAVCQVEQAHRAAVKRLETSTQSIYRMTGLSELLSTEQGEEIVLQRLQSIELARGLLGCIAIDAENEEVFNQTSFAGVSDVIESTHDFLSAVTSIPKQLLFGAVKDSKGIFHNDKHPAWKESWYSYLVRIQRKMLIGNLRYLLFNIFQAAVTSGQIENVPKEIDIEFNSQWFVSTAEQADIDLLRAKSSLSKAKTKQIYKRMI